MTPDAVARKFNIDTVYHRLTIRQDRGHYKHLHFSDPTTSAYWFDLITVPGTLLFRGDCDSYVFAREQDMLGFFRGSAHRGAPNLSYWHEKLTSSRTAALRYDEGLVEDYVLATLREWLPEAYNPGDLEGAVNDRVVSELTGDSSLDRDVLEAFSYSGFSFDDAWGQDFRAYDHWFVWACHAIVWGISEYDRHTTANGEAA